MRGLFSFLFGASMLLVIDRAAISGRSPATVHFARMAWLLIFGLLHFLLVWSGDILTMYALLGMVAFAFHGSPVRVLVAAAGALLVLHFAMYGLLTLGLFGTEAMATAPGASIEAQQMWRDAQTGTNFYPPGEAERLVALHRGPFGPFVRYRLAEEWARPLIQLGLAGPETLAYFLLGMAGFRAGFLTGAWPRRRYLRVAAVGIGIGLPAYAALAWLLVATGFRLAVIFAAETASILLRLPAIAGYAALIILLVRPDDSLTGRIAATGRAAFTNYLGASILMTFIFNGWGLGLFGAFGRAELWLFVFGAWTLMLAWSKPWLDRYRYGPFEWAWRSLARGRLEPLRGGAG
jgi:uncharacterized protein